jgi:phosphoribosylglycinamide formyltransferase-1
VRLGVLASGSGTILEAILADGLPVVVVVVDRPCRATEIATAAGIPGLVIERDSFGADFDRVSYTEKVVAAFGTIFAQPFFDAFEGRVINTHPALLPSFKGWHAVRDALSYGVKVTGCTVHVATLEVDHGPILAQRAVDVLPGDTEAILHERIKEVERSLYVQTIREIVERGSVL